MKNLGNEQTDSEDALLETFFTAFSEELDKNKGEIARNTLESEEVHQNDGFLELPDSAIEKVEKFADSVLWNPNSGLADAKIELEKQIKSSKTSKVFQEKDLEKKFLVPPRDPKKEAQKMRKNGPNTAGSKWYDLPATQISPEMKQELRLLRLRSVIDPKRHYKSLDNSKFPTHFQIGTVVEGPADYFTGRLTRKERKTSFAGELLADSNLTAYRKRKYKELQADRDRGSKRHFKKRQEKRKPIWARK